MAPEIHLGKEYNAKEVDLFAASIILFIMYSFTPPFIKATKYDNYYKLLCDKNLIKTFWAAHCKNKPRKKRYYSKEFKDLVTKMLSFEPESRLSI